MAEHDQATPRVKTLTCCCCGEYTRGRQWWNRDTGYGICPRCVDEEIGASTQQSSAYGVRGEHFDVKEDTTNG